MEDRRSIDPATAWERLQEGRIRLVDIRESHERLLGAPPGSEHIPMTDLPVGTDDPAGPQVVLLCARGQRSARALQAPGRSGWLNLAGGLEAWRQAGLPLELPESPLDPGQRERYLRHLPLAEIGVAGQCRLLQSSVLIVGAGGLGSPAALYLAAAGVGRIGLIDADRVERSNLQRQILHNDDGVGRAKTESGAARLAGLNPDIRVETIDARLDRGNADAVLAGWDVILDGSDNFPTKYLLNDACIRLGKPLVYGAVLHFAGQVSVFAAGDGHSPCYRCLFPDPPSPEDAPNCAQAGVLGAVPGVIGCLQAVETVKLLLGIGDPLIGRVLQFDALGGRMRESRLERDPGCRWCDPAQPIETYPDYEDFCGG